MAGNEANHALRNLNARRRKLGMSYAALAKNTGIHPVTVQRILSGRHGAASFANVLAIAEALGIVVHFDRTDGVEEWRERQARKKAEFLVGLSQGTSGLEGQAVPPQVLEQMIDRTSHELLAGPKLRLWSEP